MIAKKIALSFVMVNMCCCINVSAQNQRRKFIRQNIAVSGSSLQYNSSGKIQIIQSIGQTSPIGMLKNHDNTISQGFLQPTNYLKAGKTRSVAPLSFHVFPNPATDKIYLSLKEPFSMEDVEVELLDLNGRVLIHKPLTANDASLDISSLRNAPYLIRVSDQRRMMVKRFIKVSL